MRQVMLLATVCTGCFPGPLEKEVATTEVGSDTAVVDTQVAEDVIDASEPTDAAVASETSVTDSAVIETTADVAETETDSEVIEDPCPTGCGHLDGPCVKGVCASGDCIQQALSDVPCSDGKVCTIDDTCDAGACVGAERTCADALACSVDSCDEDAGGCVADTTPCECLVDEDCRDQNLCNGLERCVDNACVPGESIVCQVPANACQQNDCVAETGQCKLAAKPAGTECDDNDACTRIDACGAGATAGMCVGSDRVVCSVSDDCHSLGVCNPLSGECTSPEVNDGVECEDAVGLSGLADSPGHCAAGTCKRLPYVAVGGYHACAAFADDTIKCWGLNNFGELGTGDVMTTGIGERRIRDVPGFHLGAPLRALAPGHDYSCAATTQGMRCWGYARARSEEVPAL